MKYSTKSVKIIGTGSYVPDRIVTNKELESNANTNDEWIYKNLGIRERRIVAKNQKTSDIASKAGMNAIQAAGLKPDDIDLIIVATTTPDRKAPSTACIVQEKIKAKNAAAFDLAAVCSGFIYAFVTGAQFILTGMSQNVLVIGADVFSSIIDWSRRDCVFFGDGAGAVVLNVCEKNYGLLSAKIFADGSGKDNFTVLGGGSELPLTKENIDKGYQYFNMNGKAVFDTATSVIPSAILSVLDEAGLEINDIDYLIPHQPSINILKISAEKLGLPFCKVMTNMDKYANTSGATIPLILDETVRAGKIKKYDKIVLAGVGSGWTWGAAVMEWEMDS